MNDTIMNILIHWHSRGVRGLSLNDFDVSDKHKLLETLNLLIDEKYVYTIIDKDTRYFVSDLGYREYHD